MRTEIYPTTDGRHVSVIIPDEAGDDRRALAAVLAGNADFLDEAPVPGEKGGPGSGFRGHIGRPGKQGGSQARGAGEDPEGKLEGGLSLAALRLKVTASNAKFLARFPDEATARTVARAFHAEQKRLDALDAAAATTPRATWLSAVGAKNQPPFARLPGGDRAVPITRQEAIALNSESVGLGPVTRKTWPEVFAGDTITDPQAGWLAANWGNQVATRHRNLVKRAADAGIAIPDAVKADYPDLFGGGKPKPPEQPKKEPKTKPPVVPEPHTDAAANIVYDANVKRSARTYIEQSIGALPDWARSCVRRFEVNGSPGPEFTAGGKQFTQGGSWNGFTGVVKANNANTTINFRSDADWIVNHEVGHAVYDEWKKRGRAESEDLRQEHPDWFGTAHVRGGAVEIKAGAWKTHEAEIRKAAPLAVAWQTWHKAWVAGEDGVTDYSKSWAKEGQDTETFAEIAKAKWAYFGFGVPNSMRKTAPTLVATFQEVLDNFAETAAGHKGVMVADTRRALVGLIVSGVLDGPALDAVIAGAKGGPGSGFRGHLGRPGKVGGSEAAGSASGPTPPVGRDPTVAYKPFTQAVKTAAQIYGKVPRDSDGKLVPVETKTFYHVTKWANVEPILAHNFDLAKVHAQWVNDYAISLSSANSLKAATDYFSPNVKGAVFDHEKYAVLKVTVTGRFFDPAVDSMSFGSVTPQQYNRYVQEEGYDASANVYVYNPRAIKSISLVPQADIETARAPKAKRAGKKGGPGSGFRGHLGRPGERGGSQAQGAAPDETAPRAKVGGWANLSQDVAALRSAGVSDDDVDQYTSAMRLDSEDMQAYLKGVGMTAAQAHAELLKAYNASESEPPQRDRHIVGGAYTAERQALHDQIVNAALAGKPAAVGQPSMLMTGGLMGSGKSTVLGTDIYKGRMADYVHMDADAFRELLAKADGHAGSGFRAGSYQTETDDILAQCMERAIAGKQNILLDLSMKTEPKIRKMIDSFRDRGYATELAYVDVPLRVAVERAIKRYLGNGKATGRFVPPVAVAAHDHKNRATMDHVKGIADTWRIWSTDVPFGTRPPLLSEGGAV